LNYCFGIIQCIEAFKKEESLNKIHVEQFVAGHSMGVKRKYKDFAVRLKNVCDDYRNRITEDYLRGIAHNFKLNV